MITARRSASVAILAAVVILAGCLPGKRSDPGDLEVRNFLRDPVIAIVGGQWFPVAACSSVQLRNVELRQVRITTQAGVDLMRLDPPSGIPIGPRRFIMLDSQGVHDMRTRPNGDPPDPVLNCVDRFEQPGGLGG